MANKRSPRWARPAVDASMTLLYLLQMTPYQTGQTYHEWAGIAFVALFVTHHALNAGWLKRARKRGDARANVTILFDVALTACVTGIALSGILMSRRAVPFLTVTSLAHVVRPLHACLAYLGLICISLHVGMHVPVLHGYTRLATGSQKQAPLSPLVRAALMVASLVAGAWSFMRLGVATKLTMGMSFPDGMTPLPVLFVEHLLLAAPFVMAGAELDKVLRLRRKSS